jgi:ppGpp synthetase/RelA/SpoT-type nucleotidyltranferase
MVLPVAVPKHAHNHVLSQYGSSSGQMNTTTNVVVGSPQNPCVASTPSGGVGTSLQKMHSGNISSSSSGSKHSLSRTSSQRGSMRLYQQTHVTESFVKIEGFQFASVSPSQRRQQARHSDDGCMVNSSSSSMLTKELCNQEDDLMNRQLSKSWSSASSSLGASPMYNNSNKKFSILSHQLPSLEPSPVHRKGHALLSTSPSVPDTMLENLQKKYSVFREPLVARAFNISRLAHDGQLNFGARSGPTFEKCVTAAIILADLGADEISLSSALLYDCIDSGMLTEQQMRPMLGSERAVKVVKSISHMSYMCAKFEEKTPSAMRMCAPHETSSECLDLIGIMLAHASPSALLVRLSVALAEMRICANAVKQDGTMVHDVYVQAVSHQAMNIWAPLANRLGVWSIKSQLEDLSFSCLLPTEFSGLQQRLHKAQEPNTLVRLMDGLREALQDTQTEYLDLSGRPKHLWGVWCKMQKKGYSADRVQDVRGLRIIVNSREDCYKALRAVETSWKVVGPTKNYIKDPKKNGYQSIHVIADPGDGHLVEIQIRTDKMHYLAEYGADASHWKYKETALSPSGSEKTEDVAREANWAKFVTQKNVSIDHKCRPSGSPTEDKSLEQLMAVWNEKRKNKENSSPSSGKKTFHEYIEESGQALAPPNAEDARVIVAVVSQGSFSVQALEPGSTIGKLFEKTSLPKQSPGAKIVVNRLAGVDPSALLRTGDVIEIHTTETPAPALSRGNLMPLGGLTRKLKQSSLSA